VLLGAGATALAVVVGAGGWVGGRVYAGESAWPFGASEEAPAPDRTAEPEEEEEEPVQEGGVAEAAGDTATYRGMTLTLPNRWAAEVVADESFHPDVPGAEGDPVVEDWLVLYPLDQHEDCTDDPQSPLGDGSWSWNDTSTACKHLKILGPGAIQYGGGGFGPLTTLENRDPHNAYAPAGNPMPCPGMQRLHPDTSPDFRGPGEWDLEEVDLGGESATWTRGSVICYQTFAQEMTYYRQQMWLVPDRQILVVDGYRQVQAEAVLNAAQW
jgi:hypothetical protein